MIFDRLLPGAESKGWEAGGWADSLIKPWFQRTGLQVALEGCQRLQVAAYDPDRRQPLPVLEVPETSHRLLHLITGEAFPVELFELDEEAVEFRLANCSSRYRIPREYVAKISRLQDGWDVWSTPLGSPSVHWQAEPAASLPAGELELWWTDHGDGALSLELQFDGSPPVRWEVAASSEAKPSLVPPGSWKVTSRQPAGVAGLRTGPMILRWTETNWSWVVDGVVRMEGQRSAGGLLRIRGQVAPSKITTTAGRLFLRRSLHRDEKKSAKSFGKPLEGDDPQQDLFVTGDGTRLYGQLVMATGENAVLRSYIGTATFPWQDLVEIRLARRPDRRATPLALEGRIVHGIDVQTPGSEIRRWVFAINGTGDKQSVLHPLLGRFPREAIPVLSERQFIGEWHWLFPAMVQLGGDEGVGTPESRPLEIRLSGEWALLEKELSFPSRRSLRFRVEVAEMTPSQPGLSSARQLWPESAERSPLWDAFINGEKIGCLNHQLRARPPRFAPQVIALDVPRKVLLRGHNLWEIRPRWSGSGTQQDRVWLGRIALEVK